MNCRRCGVPINGRMKPAVQYVDCSALVSKIGKSVVDKMTPEQLRQIHGRKHNEKV